MVNPVRMLRMFRDARRFADEFALAPVFRSWSYIEAEYGSRAPLVGYWIAVNRARRPLSSSVMPFRALCEASESALGDRLLHYGVFAPLPDDRAGWNDYHICRCVLLGFPWDSVEYLRSRLSGLGSSMQQQTARWALTQLVYGSRTLGFKEHFEYWLPEVARSTYGAEQGS